MPPKLTALQNILKDLKSVLIAFSGGVDSTFLLKVAKDTLGDKVLAVIAESPTFPADEVIYAEELCQKYGVDYQIIQTAEFNDEKFLNNTKDRCYYCKSELFSKLIAIAKEKNIPYVLDGSNFDDKSDYRPGGRAKCELGVKSPLMEAGITKQEIREMSKELGVPTWDKPSYACLSSRIPYGTRITKEILNMVGEGEKFLRSLGFKQLRVRHHGNTARIEVDQEAIPEIVQEEIRDQIAKKFEELGYTYVTLDLKGYRTGSLNEIL